MKVLFTIPTPVECYIFNKIAKIIEKDHEVYFLVRRSGPSVEIAKNVLPHFIEFGSNNFRGISGKFIEMLYNDLSTYNIIKKINPDLIVGDALLGHPSKLLKIPSLAFVEEVPPGLIRFVFKYLSFSNFFISPELSLIDIGKKMITYPGLQQHMYLNPKYFNPDPTIYDYLNLEYDEKYIIFRISALGMSHDIGLTGLTNNDIRYIINKLKDKGKIFISSERELPIDLKQYMLDIPPYLFHSALFYSSLFIGETAAAEEAGLLGVPSIQVSPVDAKGNARFFDYRTFKYCLENDIIKIFSCNELEDIVSYSLHILSNDKYKQDKQEVISKYFENSFDATLFASWFISDYPRSVDLYNRLKIDDLNKIIKEHFMQTGDIF